MTGQGVRWRILAPAGPVRPMGEGAVMDIGRGWQDKSAYGWRRAYGGRLPLLPYVRLIGRLAHFCYRRAISAAARLAGRR